MTNENIINNNTIFHHPFTCMIAGPTQSGKTWLIKNILSNFQNLIDPPPNKIIYCYSTWQETFNQIKVDIPFIEFNEGIIETNNLDVKQNNLIILDDLMEQCQKNVSILDLFTIDSHHKNTSVFFMTQNLFSQGKFSRTISLNSHYLIIFNNPRDKSQINVLARQVFPNNFNFFIEAFEDATNKKYGYIFLDL